MTKSKEWRLRFGPLSFGFRLRSLELGQPGAGTGDLPADLPPGASSDSLEVGRVRLLDADAPGDEPVQ